jgi:hypothetical protein
VEAFAVFGNQLAASLFSVNREGLEMYLRKHLPAEYGPRDLFFLAAAGASICFIAALVMLTN